MAALLAPFTPFLADEIYANLVGGDGEAFGELPDSVHLADFPEPDAALVDRELEAGVEAALRAIELGRAARAHGAGEDPPAAAQGGDRRHAAPSGRRSSGSRTWSQAELNVKELEFVSEEAELVTTT